MAYIEIIKDGKVVKRQRVDDAKAKAGFVVRSRSAGQISVKLGETSSVGEYQVRVVEDTLADGPGSSDAAKQVQQAPHAAPEGPVPHLEGYEIQSRLGEGGMGVVWKAVQLSTRRLVAVKLLGIRSFGSERSQRRFEREVHLSAKLEHPAIARIYDSGLVHGAYYYALELIDGKPLDQYVKENTLETKKILELIRTVCQAVQHAHERGVIHRDLKPANILVSKDGSPHVLDFGLAKSLIEDLDGDAQVTMSIEGEATGTPAYMSPEQASGRHEQTDGRTDVYSIGVILYRLLVGESPHELSGSRWDVMRRIAQEEIRSPRQFGAALDADLEGLLRKALAQKPQDRYATPGELAEDIDNYLRGRPLIARKATFLYLLGKRAARHRIAIPAAIVSAAVASVIVLGVLPGGWIRQRLTVTHTNTVTKEPIVQRVFVPATAPVDKALLAKVAPLKGRADAAWDNVKSIDGGQGLAAKIEAATALRLTAQTYFQQNSLASAETAYQQFMGAIDEIRALDVARQKSLEARGAWQDASDKAKAAGAAGDAADLWAQAQTLAQQAQDEYAAGDFAIAQSLWEQSRLACDKAPAVAVAASRLRTAKIAYDDTLKQQDVAKLDKFGGKDWLAAKAATQRAAYAGDVEKAVAAYADAKRLLDIAVAIAADADANDLAQRMSPEINGRLIIADGLRDRGKYRAAYEEIEQALALNDKNKDEDLKRYRADLLKRDTFGEIVFSMVIEKSNWNGVPFANALDDLRIQSKWGFAINWQDLETVGIDGNTPLHINLSSCTLGKVIRTVCEDVSRSGDKLRCSVDNGTIRISLAQDPRNLITQTDRFGRN